MNDRDQRRYNRLTRVQTFGRENAADFAPGSKAQTHFGNVDQHLIDLDAAKAGQTPARVSKETLLDALLLDFKNISRTARSIALTENSFAEPYRIPDNPSESAITTHADALLLILEDQAEDSDATKTAKAALRAQFISYELPTDFVEDLRDDREAVRNANQHNQGETQDGVENTFLIGQILGNAADDIRHHPQQIHPRPRQTPRLAKRQPRRTRPTTGEKGGYGRHHACADHVRSRAHEPGKESHRKNPRRSLRREPRFQRSLPRP